MVTEKDIGRWCRYVVNGKAGAEGTLEKLEGGWATLRGEDNDGVKDRDAHDFPAGLCEVAPSDLGTSVEVAP